MPEQKIFSQACENNKQPIGDALSTIFTKPGLILEIGSGSGQHAVYFAKRLPHVRWQPSDLDKTLVSVEAYRHEAGLTNVLTPAVLDVMQPPWPVARADGVFSANTAHIMAWPAVEAMFRGVAGLLAEDDRFCLYGPFNYGGQFTSEGNKRLDAWARSLNPASGLRDFEAIVTLGRQQGLHLIEDHPMPANNHLLEFAMNAGGS